MLRTAFCVQPRSALAALLLVCVGCAGPAPAPREPPFRGTAFIDPDLIVASDPSALRNLEYAARDTRRMFDRRADAFVLTHAFLFNAAFDDETVVEVQVNAEFGDAATAERHAAFYARAIGQLPSGLRTRVETVWIHRGDQPFGGGNDNILIHTGKAAEYLRDGVLEEILMHEAAHTSLDPIHAAADPWLVAQDADGGFISDYARDHPRREDVAESFGPFFAVRHRPERISRDMAQTIEATMPNRIEFFARLELDMHPVR
ncbi:MAG: hypothetical protein F4210_16125 [Holophagales bacterium]|nr:hypothetical protein [Holophagales bacterium]MYF96996.1 hypothetical protein [Holophagales bacterium]